MPGSRIEPSLAPGGIVFQVIIDGVCVEQFPCGPADNDQEIEASADRHRRMIDEANAAGKEACVLVYDGDTGVLAYRVRLEEMA